jgi:hypothetical protein
MTHTTTISKQLCSLKTQRTFATKWLGIIFSSLFLTVNAQQTVSEFKKTLSNPTGFQVSKSVSKGKSAPTVTIKESSNTNGTEVFTGKVINAKESQAFFQFSNGEVYGRVILPESNTAYEYTTLNGKVKVEVKEAEESICTEYNKQKLPSTTFNGIGAPPSGSYVYNYQSLPGATAVVMLDFDGHTTSGSWWGTIAAAPADVTEQQITDAWKVVSEDFSPFQVNITTNEATYQAAPSNMRMRVICTPTNTAAPGTGGVAYVNIFNYGGELAPCWVFNIGDGKVMGETASHEIGHTMGLMHDGRDFPNGIHEEYYAGQGVWAPIMGVSFYPLVTHWSRGQYEYANNTEDDVVKIATQNGFGYRTDNQVDLPGQNATPLVIQNGIVSASNNYGIVNFNNDMDVFKFSTNGGAINLTASPADAFANLNIRATLYNMQGYPIMSADGASISPSTIQTTLAAGVYYFSVNGVGEGDPFTNGYSNYSSGGQYSISGTIQGDVNPPTDNCNPYITQLNTGEIIFSVEFSNPQAYVEVFATKNNLQHLASNITASQYITTNGLYRYSYIMPSSATFYATGDDIRARFYSYAAGSPGVFTPGPTSSVWSDVFEYNVTSCGTNPPPVDACTDYVQQLPNGYLKFQVTFNTPQVYVEVFSTKNGLQNIATNITASQINNANGTFTYSYLVGPAGYATGDVVKARFYSYAAGAPGVFTPGPDASTWSNAFVYNQSTCGQCVDNYESNENIASAKLIQTNTQIRALINTSTDNDWFKVVTTSAQPNLNISLSNLVVDFDIQLFDENGYYLTGSYWGSNNSEHFSYYSYTGRTYYILVYGYIGYHSDECYHLQASTFSGSPTASFALTEDKSAQTKVLEQNLLVFPNPSRGKDVITLSFKENYDREIVRVLDMRGRTMIETEVNITNNIATLPLEGLTAGAYIVEAGNAKQLLIIE